jgi:hypothetical protein
MQRTLWRGRDYQTIPLWRRVTRRHVERASRRHFVIVPMTIVDRDVLTEIIDPLEGVRIVVLTASRDVIAARIGEAKKESLWRLANLDRCLSAFKDPAFGEHVDTSKLTPNEIASLLLRSPVALR